MTKASEKIAKRFLVEPRLFDKLKEWKDLLNDKRDQNVVKKVSENDILESMLTIFQALPDEYVERIVLYREYIQAKEEMNRLCGLKADQVPELIEKALSLLSEES